MESENECKIYYHQDLKIHESIKIRLIENLEKLGVERNDWSEISPILDIIDPDLYPNYEFKYKPDLKFDYETHFKLRHEYCWFPTDIEIDKENKIKLLGPINGLDLKTHADLTKCLIHVLENMIPDILKIVSTQRKLQIVVKAQKYIILPGMNYSGKWHLEGKTENIIATGVYYCKIDEGFPVDELLFRGFNLPSKRHSSDFDDREDERIDMVYKIFEGTGMVFSNNYPHKFRNLLNETNRNLSRLFINFFIIDPLKPLESTSKIWKWDKIIINFKLPKNLKEYLKYFLWNHLSLLESKSKRKVIRELLSKEYSGYDFIWYGNAGGVEFFDSFNRLEYDRFKKMYVDKFNPGEEILIEEVEEI